MYRTHRLRCVAWVALVALRSLHTDRNVCIGCVGLDVLRSLHTDRNVRIGCVALHALRSLYTDRIVYVERYVQTIHIPFDTPASEVFSRPSTQMGPDIYTGGGLGGAVVSKSLYKYCHKPIFLKFR